MKRGILLLVAMLLTFTANAAIRLPKIFSDNMIFQRGEEIKIWGWAGSGEAIFVSFNGKKEKTKASETGEWEIKLPAMKAGGPYTLFINDLKIKNILIGDVYLCSGQSNMELTMKATAGLYKKDMDSITNHNVRYVKIPVAYNFKEPQNDFRNCDWKEITPANAPDISALCYYLGLDINLKENVPVGIVNASCGGSPIEAWIHYNALKDYPKYQQDADKCIVNGYIENTIKTESAKIKAWNSILNETDRGLGMWHSPSLDDSKWDLINMFSNWGVQNGKIVNGAHWFRQEIDVPEKCANMEATLRLGNIVDADSVFVNGKWVGSTGYQYPARIYTIKPGILHEGRNVIVVRIVSYNGEPKFVKDKPYKLTFKNGFDMNLSENWKYMLGSSMRERTNQTFFEYKPIGLYNAMIAPLNGFRFCGTVWMQGESNTDRAGEYSDLLQKMVADWRSRQGYTCPFFIIQLANYMDTHSQPYESNWAALRNAQRDASTKIQNAALVTALGLGEANDVHPAKKRDLADRVFMQIERMVYGKEKLIAEGPVVKSVKALKDGSVILSFTVDDIKVRKLTGFELAGESGKFFRAKANTEGKTVTVSCLEVNDPKQVRYAWDDNPALSLYNSADMPAASFQLPVGYSLNEKPKLDKEEKSIKAAMEKAKKEQEKELEKQKKAIEAAKKQPIKKIGKKK